MLGKYMYRAAATAAAAVNGRSQGHNLKERATSIRKSEREHVAHATDNGRKENCRFCDRQKKFG